MGLGYIRVCTYVHTYVRLSAKASHNRYIYTIADTAVDGQTDGRADGRTNEEKKRKPKSIRG